MICPKCHAGYREGFTRCADCDVALVAENSPGVAEIKKGKSKHPSKKIGRNDPCSCGSGKKYKNCCLAKDEANREDINVPGNFPDPNIGPLDGGVWGLAKRGGLNWANMIGKIKKK